jgi:hypothetical protein
MAKASALDGLRKGKLVALARVENDPIGKAQWVCQCDCGGAHIVRADNYKAGRVTHCPACPAPARDSLRLDAWFHLVLLGQDVTGQPGFVDGLAGFCVVTKGERELYQSPWITARRLSPKSNPVLSLSVRAIGRLGVIRCKDTNIDAGAWVRRNSAAITYHSFNEGDKVWAEWYSRTRDWRGPLGEIDLPANYRESVADAA